MAHNCGRYPPSLSWLFRLPLWAALRQPGLRFSVVISRSRYLFQLSECQYSARIQLSLSVLFSLWAHARYARCACCGCCSFAQWGSFP
jgi:hypothetical protein